MENTAKPGYAPAFHSEYFAISFSLFPHRDDGSFLARCCTALGKFRHCRRDKWATWLSTSAKRSANSFSFAFSFSPKEAVLCMHSNKAFVITAGLPKCLSSLAQRSFSNALGFCCCPIVHQTFGFPTGETTQIIYFLFRENLSVTYHGFEGHFPWMK